MADCSYVVINGQKLGRDCFIGIDSYYAVFDFDKEQEKKLKNFVSYPKIEDEVGPYYEFDSFGNLREIDDYPYKKIGIVGENVFLAQLVRYIKTDPQIEFMFLSNDGKPKIASKEKIINDKLKFIGFKIKNCQLNLALKLTKQNIVEATKLFLSYELKEQGSCGIPKKARASRNVVIDIYCNNERIAMYDNCGNNYFGAAGGNLRKIFAKK